MGYFNEFPHTKGYDGDLGWLIKMYNELLKFYENIDNILKNNLENILQEYLENGELFIDAIYTPETENINFIFEKVGENNA